MNNKIIKNQHLYIIKGKNATYPLNDINHLLANEVYYSREYDAVFIRFSDIVTIILSRI